MKVDDVAVLNGFIMKGISLSGEVEHGCLANDDQLVIKRNGSEVLTTIARIVNVQGLTSAEAFNGEVYQGESVTLFIPDGKQEDVQPGDVVMSHGTSCKNIRRR